MRNKSSPPVAEAVTQALRIGLFGIGLDAYWPQFAGLKERLEDYVALVARKLERPGVEIVNLGLVDSPEKAMAAGHQFRREDVDIIFSMSPPMRFLRRCFPSFAARRFRSLS